MTDHAKRVNSRSGIKKLICKIRSKVDYYKFYRSIGHTPFAAWCKVK